MGTLQKMFRFSKGITRLIHQPSFASQNIIPAITSNSRYSFPPQSAAVSIHTTPIRPDLMEFFDDKKNWGENEVKCGRAWRLDELRIKSNVDLHKLWYVLLKERNMLLTMEHEGKERMEFFPNPERIDKVKISMENVETVVRERNRAYYQLETGQTGERPGRLVYNQLGLKFYYRCFEHIVPKWMNTKWHERHKFSFGGFAVSKFLKFYREKLWDAKRKSRVRDRNHVMHLLKRNPSLDKQMLSSKYPHVDIDKLIRDDKVRGHYVPK